MSRFFRRAALEPIKFSFEVSILALERLPPSLPDSSVVIRWHRGSKRGGASKDVRITKAGGAVCEKFELKATMFRDDKSSKYDTKVLSFSVTIVSDQHSPSKPDICGIDLATLQLDECSGACVRLALSGGALDGALLSLKIVPRLRGAGGSSVGKDRGTGAGDASDASDASVMSQRGAEAGSDACDAEDSHDTSRSEVTDADAIGAADVDEEALALQQETLALGQLKLAAARRKAAAVKYAAGDGASGDDHEARAVHHDMQAIHHRQLAAIHRNQAAELKTHRAVEEMEGGVGTGGSAQVRTRRASGGAAAAAKEADPHNQFRGRFVTDKSGAVVRAEESSTGREESTVAADYAMGMAAAAAASGVGLACNGMANDAPGDVEGNENSACLGGSWWCGVCL